MIEIPMRCHLEFRCVNLIKRKGKISEPLNECAFRRPERPDHFIVVAIYDLIDRRFDRQQIVSRSSENAIRFQYALRFLIKAVEIEPVQCLCDHDQIYRPRIDAAVFCGRDMIRDMLLPLRDRKSTRLNSSHSQISYAVFCLKKKKK